MKAITLHQPWASLIAAGTKTVETRSWAPPPWVEGQRIAIHAGKQVAGDDGLNEGTRLAVIRLFGKSWRDRIPRGAVVATALLEKAVQVQSVNPEGVRLFGNPRLPQLLPDPYGDFSPGRWLWFLRDVERVEPPVAVLGKQKIWNWDPERYPAGRDV